MHDCQYKDECLKYVMLEQEKKDKRRKELLGEKKNFLYILKLIKYRREIVKKPECDTMCWVALEAKRDKENKHKRGIQ